MPLSAPVRCLLKSFMRWRDDGRFERINHALAMVDRERDIRDLFGGIVQHICDDDPATKERSEARKAIDQCLINALWQTQRLSRYNRLLGSQDYGDLDLQIEGSAKWYFVRRGSAAFAERKKQRL